MPEQGQYLCHADLIGKHVEVVCKPWPGNSYLYRGLLVASFAGTVVADADGKPHHIDVAPDEIIELKDAQQYSMSGACYNPPMRAGLPPAGKLPTKLAEHVRTWKHKELTRRQVDIVRPLRHNPLVDVMLNGEVPA